MVVDMVARAKDVEVYAERGWEYTFLGSPFPAHSDFRAMDLYQGGDFGDPALSPINGTVLETMEFESPSLCGESLPEYLTLIRAGNHVAKIMHIKPSVREGDKVDVGDELGCFIKNGYFTFWVDAALHLEVRSLQDYVRARGGFELEPCFRKEAGKKKVSELEGTVMRTTERNVVVSLNLGNVVRVGDIYTFVDGATVIGYAGVLGVFNPGEGVFFNEIRIGKINRVGSYMSVFQTDGAGVYANNIRFAGISFMFGRNLVRLLPEKYGKLQLQEGERVKITLGSNQDESRGL